MINRKFQIFLFISVCIFWGTTWMAMKIAVLTVPPILATGLRFLIASPVLFFLAYIYKFLYTAVYKCIDSEILYI